MKWSALAVILACASAAGAQPAATDDSTPILGVGSRWRYHVALSYPMVSAASAKAAGMPADAESPTINVIKDGLHNEKTPLIGVVAPPPLAGWILPDFDDLAWASHRGPLQADPFGTGWPAELSSEVALVCGRFKFVVNDPAGVRKLRLSTIFRGGIVAWLNGKEVARKNLPAGELSAQTPGEDYPDAATLLEPKKLLHWYDNRDKKEQFLMRDRRMDWTDLDPSLLRKGVNVLAVEVHRSDYPAVCKQIGLRWGANGLTELHLTAQAAAGAIVQAVGRPPGLQVWNADVAEQALNLDFADPAEPLRPVRIVAARNGAFSGALVVGSTEPIEGLSCKVGPLKSAGGEIPASAITVRYGALDRRSVGAKAHGWPALAFDGLLEEPPATVELTGLAKEVRAGSQNADRTGRGLPPLPVPGAVVPVWLTVKVPADAAPGEYRGEAVLTTKGGKPVRAAVELHVSPWKLPDIADYQCILNVYQSPDTLALHYKTPLWSKEHWALIERSLAKMGELGNDFLYLPLLSKDQFGNDESMVSWIKQADGSFKHDFTVMDRYLDVFLKHHDARRLKMIVLVAWGTGTRTNEASVTLLDPATGAKSDMNLPAYGTKECEDLWRPVLLAIRDRLKTRKLDHLIMLGMPCDIGPKPEHVAMFRNILPEAPWMRACHPDNASMPYDAANPTKTVPVACVEHVWWGPIPDPATKRQFGWQLNRMRVSFNRFGYGPLCLLGFRPPHDFRIWLEVSLAAGDRGAGRVGADFYDENIKLEKLGAGDFERNTGARGTLYNRFPKSNVYQIGLPNNTTDLLPPGPSGPVASARYENAREGIQTAETVILVEQALLGKKVPADAEAAAWKLIDERINCLRLHSIGFGQAGWQERSRKLFDLAAEVAGKTAPAKP